MLSISASTSSRLLKKAAHCVLSRPSPCDVPQGYVSVAALPAALLSAFLSSLHVRTILDVTSKPAFLPMLAFASPRF
jgi:hypothetical protein